MDRSQENFDRLMDKLRKIDNQLFWLGCFASGFTAFAVTYLLLEIGAKIGWPKKPKLL